MNEASMLKKTNAPVQKRGQRTKGMILSVAKMKVIESGIEGLVLREIADEMGITHGNLQYYFKTKRDLLAALFDSEIKSFTTGLQEAVAAATSKAGKLSAIVDAGFEQLKNVETKLWRALISVSDHDPEIAKILKTENEFYERTLAEELASIAPELSAQRCSHIAKIVRMILDGAAIEFTYNAPRSPSVIALKGEITAIVMNLVEAA